MVYTLWWSPNVSQSLRLTSTPSTVTLELSRTWTRDTWHITYHGAYHWSPGNGSCPNYRNKSANSGQRSPVLLELKQEFGRELDTNKISGAWRMEGCKILLSSRNIKFKIGSKLQYLFFGWCYIKEILVENVSDFQVTCHAPLCISGTGQWPTPSARACWGADPSRPGVIHESLIWTPIL